MTHWIVDDAVCAAGKAVNEDRVGTAGRLAWVLDGASPLGSDQVTPAPSDAAWIVDLVTAALQDAAAAPPQALPEITAATIRRIRERRDEWSHRPAVPPSAAFGIVQALDPERVEYLVLGDVTVVVETAAGDVRAVTDHAVERTSRPQMAAFTESLHRTGSHREARGTVEDALIEHRRRWMNREGGYFILSDDERSASQAAHGTIDGPVRRVLLCSDGFSRVVDTFALAATWRDLLAGYDEGTSLAAFVERLRAAERADGDALAHPRWAISDDAAAIVVRAAAG